jgi:hypothetical protein
MRARSMALVLALAGCGGAPSVASKPYGLSLSALLAAPQSQRVSIANVQLRLAAVSAVSDRSSGDPRAGVDHLDLAAGAAVEQSWPTAPPGLYSGVSFALGDAVSAGIELTASAGGPSVHVTLSSGPLDAFCPVPALLERGQRVQLTLRADPSSWLDGVDLATAVNDNDDSGLLISSDDNANLGAIVIANVARSFTLDCALH